LITWKPIMIKISSAGLRVTVLSMVFL